MSEDIFKIPSLTDIPTFGDIVSKEELAESAAEAESFSESNEEPQAEALTESQDEAAENPVSEEPSEANEDIAGQEEKIPEEEPTPKRRKRSPKKVKAEKDNSPIAIFGTDITENQLAELKAQYKKIFKTRLVDGIFVWHRLQRRNFANVIASTKDIQDEEERIAARERGFVREALVYPRGEALEDFLADEDVFVTTLSEEILYRSGFIPPQTEQV